MLFFFRVRKLDMALLNRREMTVNFFQENGIAYPSFLVHGFDG